MKFRRPETNKCKTHGEFYERLESHMTVTAVNTHNLIASQFHVNVLYASVQQRNCFEFNFDVEVLVEKVCDERRQNSAMESAFVVLKRKHFRTFPRRT